MFNVVRWHLHIQVKFDIFENHKKETKKYLIERMRHTDFWQSKWEIDHWNRGIQHMRVLQRKKKWIKTKKTTTKRSFSDKPLKLLFRFWKNTQRFSWRIFGSVSLNKSYFYPKKGTKKGKPPPPKNRKQYERSMEERWERATNSWTPREEILQHLRNWRVCKEKWREREREIGIRKELYMMKKNRKRKKNTHLQVGTSDGQVS